MALERTENPNTPKTRSSENTELNRSIPAGAEAYHEFKQHLANAERPPEGSSGQSLMDKFTKSKPPEEQKAGSATDAGDSKNKTGNSEKPTGSDTPSMPVPLFKETPVRVPQPGDVPPAQTEPSAARPGDTPTPSHRSEAPTTRPGDTPTPVPRIDAPLPKPTDNHAPVPFSNIDAPAQAPQPGDHTPTPTPIEPTPTRIPVPENIAPLPRASDTDRSGQSESGIPVPVPSLHIETHTRGPQPGDVPPAQAEPSTTRPGDTPTPSHRSEAPTTRPGDTPTPVPRIDAPLPKPTDNHAPVPFSNIDAPAQAPQPGDHAPTPTPLEPTPTRIPVPENIAPLPRAGDPERSGKPESGTVDHQTHHKPESGAADQTQHKPESGAADQTHHKPESGAGDQTHHKPESGAADQTHHKPESGAGDQTHHKPESGAADQTHHKPESGAGDQTHHSDKPLEDPSTKPESQATKYDSKYTDLEHNQKTGGDGNRHVWKDANGNIEQYKAPNGSRWLADKDKPDHWLLVNEKTGKADPNDKDPKHSMDGKMTMGADGSFQFFNTRTTDGEHPHITAAAADGKPLDLNVPKPNSSEKHTVSEAPSTAMPVDSSVAKPEAPQPIAYEAGHPAQHFDAPQPTRAPEMKPDIQNMEKPVLSEPRVAQAHDAPVSPQPVDASKPVPEAPQPIAYEAGHPAQHFDAPQPTRAPEIKPDIQNMEKPVLSEPRVAQAHDAPVSPQPVDASKPVPEAPQPIAYEAGHPARHFDAPQPTRAPEIKPDIQNMEKPVLSEPRVAQAHDAPVSPQPIDASKPVSEAPQPIAYEAGHPARHFDAPQPTRAPEIKPDIQNMEKPVLSEPRVAQAHDAPVSPQPIDASKPVPEAPQPIAYEAGHPAQHFDAPQPTRAPEIKPDIQNMEKPVLSEPRVAQAHDAPVSPQPIDASKPVPEAPQPIAYEAGHPAQHFDAPQPTRAPEIKPDIQNMEKPVGPEIASHPGNTRLEGVAEQTALQRPEHSSEHVAVAPTDAVAAAHGLSDLFAAANTDLNLGAIEQKMAGFSLPLGSRIDGLLDNQPMGIDGSFSPSMSNLISGLFGDQSAGASGGLIPSLTDMLENIFGGQAGQSGSPFGFGFGSNILADMLGVGSVGGDADSTNVAQSQEQDQGQDAVEA